MPLFLVKRVVGDVTQTEVDAAVFRAKACAYEFSGLQWLSSYWHKEGGISYCVYEAESKEQLEAHAVRAQVECDEVWPVSLLTPEQYSSSRAWMPRESAAT